MFRSTRLDVTVALAPARRRLGIAQAARATGRGLIAGTAAGAVLLVIAHLVTLPSSRVLALGCVAAGLIAGLTWGIARWPDPMQAARAVDSHFGLQDRFTSALELHASEHPLAVLQRADVARRAKYLTLTRVARLRPNLRDVGVWALALLCFAALWPTANRAAAVAPGARAGGAGARIQQAAVVSIPTIWERLNSGLRSDSAQTAQQRLARRALASLQRTLKTSPSLSGALRAVSLTQQQLQRISRSLRPMKPASLAALSRALKGVDRQPNGKQASGNDAARLAATLRRLAASLSRMSPAERQKLSSSLQKASQSPSDAKVRASIHLAATWLGKQDVRRGAAALRHAASRLSRQATARRAQQQINSAAAQLNTLKRQIAGLDRSKSKAGSGSQNNRGATRNVRNSSQSGTQGAAGSKNVGRTYSKRAGKRRGLSEDVRANAGRGSVRGGTSIPGRIGTGGPVSGELLQGTSQSRGSKFKSIYIRGHEGKGGRTVGLAQPGTPRQDTATAYQQVVARYVRTAHAALDRARVPPSLRSYVRKYFTVVSH